MFAVLRFFLLVALALASTLGPACPRAFAQSEEARLLFERGNDHLARALRTRARLRERELERALDAYLGVLRLGTRTRNVIFNTALTLAELGRHEEAFNYYAEYLRSFDLDEDERAEGQRRLDALRPSVAVLRVDTNPPGAAVRIGRRDLPVRGTTPIELAVAPGAHAIFATLEGHREASAEAVAVTGTSAEVSLELSPLPVSVQVIAPGQGRLTLDERVIEPGRTIEVEPGAHLLRLEVEGSPPVERRFEVSAGDPPLVLELAVPPPRFARLTVSVDTPAEVLLDELLVGRGQSLAIDAAPGRHELYIRAPGRSPLSHALALEPGQALRLDVSLAALPDETPLHIARAVLGGAALLSAATSIGLGVHALDLSAEWNQKNADRWADFQPPREPTIAELHALGERVEAAALATDILFGTTAALGIAALITLFIPPPRGEESTVRVSAVPMPNGAMGAMSWRTH